MARFEVQNDEIDFARYLLPPEEKSRIVRPSSMNEAINELSTGKAAFEGLRLPWAKTNHLVRFPPGKVSLWTGKSHHGKTQLLKQLMLYAVKCDQKVAIASMEETPGEVLRDMCSMATLQERPNPEWVDVFTAWADEKIYIYDQQNLVHPDRILGVMNYCARELGVTQFVIDSWMRMDIDGDDFDWHRQFINILQMHARNAAVHAHLVVHMTKGDGKEGPQSFETVRGSGDILNQVDKIFNVWRNKKPRHQRTGGVGGNEPDGLLIVEKQRGRPNWIGPISIWMDRSSGQFVAEREHMPMGIIPGINPESAEDQAKTVDIFKGYES